MPRAVWTGSLAFGLVSIPIGLYPATEPKDVRFHLVDPESGRRVQYRRVVELPVDEPTDPGVPPAAGATASAGADLNELAPAGPAPTVREVEVDFGRLARGYEIDRDRYAIVEQEEIERIRPTRSTTIEIEHFVPLDDIDPVYFEKSYFLAPRGEAERPYLILLRALEATGLAGIGRFVLRTKPHLVAIRPTRGILGLETLFFADEVRAPEAIAANVADPSDREIELAEQLVDVLAEEWSPERYGDEYREELLRLIQEKTPVERQPAEPTAPPRPGVEELMAALKRSVEAAKRRRSDAEGTSRSRQAG